MSEHKQVGQASRCKPESQSNSSMAQVWRSIDRMRQAFTAVRTSWASCNADTLHNTEQCHSCHCIFVCLSLSLSFSFSLSLSLCLSVCLSLSLSLSLSRACSLHTDRSAASPLWQCRPPRPRSSEPCPAAEVLETRRLCFRGGSALPWGLHHLGFRCSYIALEDGVNISKFMRFPSWSLNLAVSMQ